MRGEFGRNLYEIQKRRILKERERNKMIRASLMISKRQRILKARKVVASMAAKIYKNSWTRILGICIITIQELVTII